MLRAKGTRATGVLVAWLAAAGSAGCHGTTTQAGGLEVLLDTDMPTPDRFDTLVVEVRQRTPEGAWGAPLLSYPLAVTTPTSLPQRLSLAAGTQPDQTVLIDATARKNGPTGPIVVFREVQIQVPRDRLAELEILISSTCVNVVCPSGQSCDPSKGACEGNFIDVTTLPNYDPNFDASHAIGPTVDATVTPPVPEAGESLPETGGPPPSDGGAEPDADAGCPSGQVDCDGGCVSLGDPHTCGSCSNDCTHLPGVLAASVTCATGHCAYSCASDHADCADSGVGCATSLASTSTCGACGTMCTAGAPYCATGSGGTYGCATNCPAATPTLCGGSCVDLGTDDSHCSACDGHACANSHHCVSSSCQCTGGARECPNGWCAANDVNACGASCTACTAPTGGTVSCNGTSCIQSCTQAGYGVCSGVCVDLDHDSSNCGACGHGCGGIASCNGSGVCSPWTVVTSTSTVIVGTDGTHVDWADSVADQLLQVPLLSTGASAQVLGNDSNLGSARGVAVAGGTVGYIDNAGFSVQSVTPLPGRSPIAIYTPAPPSGTVYLLESLAVDPLGQYGFFKQLQYASATGYGPTSLYRCSLGSVGSCTSITTYASSAFEPSSIAVSANGIFWSNKPGNSVGQYPLTGSTFTSVATNQPGASFVALDSTYVYWIDALANGNFNIYRTSQTSPSTPQAVAMGLSGSVNSFATDGTYVYYATTSGTTDSVISYVPVGGGAAKTLPTSGANQIQAAGGYLVWVDTESQKVYIDAMRAPP